jgi:hypothetical protein
MPNTYTYVSAARVELNVIAADSIDIYGAFCYADGVESRDPPENVLENFMITFVIVGGQFVATFGEIEFRKLSVEHMNPDVDYRKYRFQYQNEPDILDLIANKLKEVFPPGDTIVLEHNHRMIYDHPLYNADQMYNHISNSTLSFASYERIDALIKYIESKFDWTIYNVKPLLK